jgi:hypothetical protein
MSRAEFRPRVDAETYHNTARQILDNLIGFSRNMEARGEITAQFERIDPFIYARSIKIDGEHHRLPDDYQYGWAHIVEPPTWWDHYKYVMGFRNKDPFGQSYANVFEFEGLRVRQGNLVHDLANLPGKLALQHSPRQAYGAIFRNDSDPDKTGVILPPSGWHEGAVARRSAGQYILASHIETAANTKDPEGMLEFVNGAIEDIRFRGYLPP